MTKTTKAVLFASLIATMILPFSAMDIAEAQLDDKQRVLQKQLDIKNNFDKFLQLQEKSDTVQAQIHELQEQNDKNNDAQMEVLEAEMKQIQVQLEQNQQKQYELYEIPQEKTDKLLRAMDRIQGQFSFASDKIQEPQLNGMFVDSEKEVIIVLANPRYAESQPSSADGAATAQSIDSEVKSVAGDDVDVIITTMYDQASPCNYDHERDDFCQPAAGGVQISTYVSGQSNPNNLSTLGFAAINNSGKQGFVTVAHAILFPTNNPPVFSGQSIYQPSVFTKIGTVVNGYYSETHGCDCIFVEKSAGRTIEDEVAYNSSFLLDISGFKGKSQTSTGATIMMSGSESDVEWGTIVSRYNVGTDWVYASYSSAQGDSGAPVGKVSGGNIDIYGIHKGRTSGGGTYAMYVPYDKIDSYLNLQ